MIHNRKSCGLGGCRDISKPGSNGVHIVAHPCAMVISTKPGKFLSICIAEYCLGTFAESEVEHVFKLNISSNIFQLSQRQYMAPSNSEWPETSSMTASMRSFCCLQVPVSGNRPMTLEVRFTSDHALEMLRIRGSKMKGTSETPKLA